MGLIHTYIAEKSTSAKGNKMKTGNALAKSKNYDTQNQDALFDMRVDTITEGMIPYYTKTLKKLPYANAQAIVNFVMALNTEINPSKNYRKSIVAVLCRLSKHNGKNYNDMTRQDILDFLDSFRKPEASDPLHKWIGTYNLFRIILIKFFKWLYSPDIESEKRIRPPIVENIPQLKRKEKSVYKPSDMWSAQDDLIFLRYCPSKRMKCYHTMSGDLSARPLYCPTFLFLKHFGYLLAIFSKIILTILTYKLPDNILILFFSTYLLLHPIFYYYINRSIIK